MIAKVQTKSRHQVVSKVPRAATAKLHSPLARQVKKASPSRLKADISPAIAEPPVIFAQARTTKKALVTSLLQNASGAPMPELMRATGWQAHSVRAALTGLRKDGHQIVHHSGTDGIATYRIVS